MPKFRSGQPRGPASPRGEPRSRSGFRRPGRKPARAPEPEPAVAETMRIAKAMARAGLCSRRDAERWIGEGRVKVNGEVLASPARDVGPSDKIEVDGQPLQRAEPAQLWRFHKPRGCVTTHRDPEGRPTVFEKLPREMPRVISIGRLDFNTEGLLLLTTDGGLARHFELPATGWLRRYRVRANGLVTQEQLDALKDGVEVEGVRYGPIEATLDRSQGANVWLTLGLREGKNREVRKILGSLGLEVNRLIRISFGPFQLLDLEEGMVERVKRRVLAEQLGPRLAAEFGLDKVDAEERPSKNTGFVARKPEPEAEPAEPVRGGKKPFGARAHERPRGGQEERSGERPAKVARYGLRRPGRDDDAPGAGKHGSETFGKLKPFRDRRPDADRRADSDRPPPGDRPQGARPHGRPGGRPEGRPGGRPDGRPHGGKPGGRHDGRPSGGRPKPRSK